MKTITREDAFKLIGLIRSIAKKEFDLTGFIDDNAEQSDMELDFLGVTNGFLSEVIYAMIGYEVEVDGDVEELYSCPCCGFRTLTESYNLEEGTGYDICPYCKWEDDGTTDIVAYRSINKGSIEDYRNKINNNFNRFYINKWIK